MRPFLDLLEAKDARTVKVVLTGLNNLLTLAEKLGGTQSLCLMIEEMQGLDKLEALQSHENEDVYKKVFAIIDTYFGATDDTEPELAPKTEGGQLDFKKSSDQAPEGGFKF